MGLAFGRSMKAGTSSRHAQIYITGAVPAFMISLFPFFCYNGPTSWHVERSLIVPVVTAETGKCFGLRPLPKASRVNESERETCLRLHQPIPERSGAERYQKPEACSPKSRFQPKAVFGFIFLKLTTSSISDAEHSGSLTLLIYFQKYETNRNEMQDLYSKINSPFHVVLPERSEGF